jgi:hypothetical protein
MGPQVGRRCPLPPLATARLASAIAATTTRPSLWRQVGSSSPRHHLHHRATSPPPLPLAVASAPSSNLREREREGERERRRNGVSPRPQVAQGQFLARIVLVCLDVGLLVFYYFLFLRWFLFQSSNESLRLLKRFCTATNSRFPVVISRLLLLI